MEDVGIVKKGKQPFVRMLIRKFLPNITIPSLLTLESGFAGGAYGYVAMGPYQGGQAQYIRVPYAEFNCLPLPAGTDHEADFILLAYIFPTGWHGVVLFGFQPGESIAVFGARPIGLMAEYSAKLRGASKVYVVDSVKERLQAAEKIGCVTVSCQRGY